MPKSKKRANFVSVAPAKAPATSTPPALEKPRVAKLRGANSPKPALLKHARLVVETRALAGLKAHPKNPRVHPVAGSAGWETLRQSLADVYFDPLIFNRRNGMLVSGHLRLKVLLEMGCERADVVVLDLPEKEHLRIMLRANTNTGDWHTEQLTALLQGMGEPEQLLAGFDLSAINDLGLLLNEDEPPDSDTARKTLAEQFIVPPFSVLDARQGYWQDRKRAWIALGIESELGRGSQVLTSARAPRGGCKTYREI